MMVTRLMSLIAVNNLQKSYGDKLVLDGVSFAIQARDRIGLIGANGAGKSTIIRVLLGQEEPDNGTVIKRRNLSMVAVEQSPEFEKGVTVKDVVSRGLRAHQHIQKALQEVEAKMAHASEELGANETLQELLETQAELTDKLQQLGGWNVEHLAQAAMQALSVPAEDRVVDTLSLGERRRLALCVALIEAHDLLILDEPTNHLDVEAIDWLEKIIVDYPGAILMVSHDRYLLDRTVERLLEIDRGDLRSYEGNYTNYMVSRAERYAMESKQEEQRQKSITSELQWARRSAPARTSKQRARLDRLDAVMAESPKQKVLDAQFRIPYPSRISKTILELENLGHGFETRTLFSDLNLIIKKGDRLGIIGPNGAGKSTLLRIILGETEPQNGRVVRGPNTEMIYVDQGRSDLDPQASLLDAVGEYGDFVFIGDEAVPIQGFLSGLLFDGATQRMKVNALSGGERSRAVMAKHLCRKGNMIILDEPTNDLDLPSLRVLEDALVEYPGCAMIVSHDRYFLDRVTTAILAFEKDGIHIYEGNYSQYVRLKSQVERPNESASATALTKKKVKPKAAKTKRSYREEQEYANIEEKILKAESIVEALQTRLNDPEELRKLGPEVTQLMSKLDSAREIVEVLYARWEELAQYD
jgi:ABC transport system ATP-binding/permease protein